MNDDAQVPILNVVSDERWVRDHPPGSRFLGIDGREQVIDTVTPMTQVPGLTVPSWSVRSHVAAH